MAMNLQRVGILEQTGISALTIFDGGDTDIVSGTSVSPTFPAGIQVGDEMFAFIVRRSSVTPPADWDFVIEQKCQNDNFLSIDQWTSVYRKTYEASDGSDITFTQSASGVMIGHVFVVRPVGNGTILVEDSGVRQFKANHHGGAGYNHHTIPDLTATKTGQIGLAGSSCLFANTPPNSTYFINNPFPGNPAENHTQTSVEDTVDNRLCVTAKVLSNAEVFEGGHRHEQVDNGGVCRGGEVSLLLGW